MYDFRKLLTMDKDQQKAIDAIENINLIYDSPLDDEKRKNAIIDAVIIRPFQIITERDAQVEYLSGIMEWFLAERMGEVSNLPVDEYNMTDIQRSEFDPSNIDIPEEIYILSDYLSKNNISLAEACGMHMKAWQVKATDTHVRETSNVSSDDAEYMSYFFTAMRAFDEYTDTNKHFFSDGPEALIKVMKEAVDDIKTDRLNAKLPVHSEVIQDVIKSMTNKVYEAFSEVSDTMYDVSTSKEILKKAGMDHTASGNIVSKENEYYDENGKLNVSISMGTFNKAYVDERMLLGVSEDIGRMILGSSQFNKIVNTQAKKIVTNNEQKKNVSFSNTTTHVFACRSRADSIKVGELAKEFISSAYCKDIIAKYGAVKTNGDVASVADMLVTAMAYNTTIPQVNMEAHGVVIIMASTVSCGQFHAMVNELINELHPFLKFALQV